MSRIFGANWKTSVSGIGDTIASILLAISLIPYTLPTELSTLLSPNLKKDLLIAALVAKTILGVWNAVQQKDKNVTGGTTQQTDDGSVAGTSSTSVKETESAPKQ